MQLSPLLAHLVDVPQARIWDFYVDGEYPGLEVEKAEVEAGVAAAQMSAVKAQREVAQTITDTPAFADYARYDLGVDLVEEAPRLAAFLAYASGVQEAERDLHFATLAHPRAGDRAFDIARGDELYQRLTRDGLLPLTAELIPDEHPGAYAHLVWGEQALFPHPWLTAAREFVFELVELAADPTVTVSIAIDPFRRVRASDVPTWLLEDYWHGVVLDQKSLDSLDAKHVGDSFHAAAGRNEADDHFFPLLGTWIHWGRRGDDDRDPVKTMFVEEVVPPDSRVSSDDRHVWTRAAHGERDTTARSFTHLDGKVKLYEQKSYGASVIAPNAPLGPASTDRKLWRVDGPLTDERFADLLGTYFRGNELVGEHFKDALRWPAAA